MARPAGQRCSDHVSSRHSYCDKTSQVSPVWYYWDEEPKDAVCLLAIVNHHRQLVTFLVSCLLFPPVQQQRQAKHWRPAVEVQYCTLCPQHVPRLPSLVLLLPSTFGDSARRHACLRRGPPLGRVFRDGQRLGFVLVESKEKREGKDAVGQVATRGG